MTMQEVLDRVNDIIDNHNHHELDLLRSDLEDDIIWERKMRKYKKDNKSGMVAALTSGGKRYA